MPGWDYALGGKYFITICTKKMICCFGEIVNGEMMLNEMGEIVNKYWWEIPNGFPNTYLDEFQIMPNHIHGIIVMRRSQKNNDLERLNQLDGLEQRERRDAINRVSTCQPQSQQAKHPQHPNNNPQNTNSNPQKTNSNTR